MIKLLMNCYPEFHHTRQTRHQFIRAGTYRNGALLIAPCGRTLWQQPRDTRREWERL